jgi:hypothetical protein
LLPNAADRVRGVYVGVAPLALALLGLGLWRPHAVAAAVAVATTAAVLYALGPPGPLYALVAALPLGTWFQGVDRALVIAGLGVAVLAGAGLDVLLGAQAATRPPHHRLLAAAAAIAVVVALGGALGAARGHLRLVGFACTSLALLAIGILAPRRPATASRPAREGSARWRGAVAGLALLGLADLFGAQQHGGRMPSQARDYLARNDALYAEVRRRQGFDRFYAWAPFAAGAPLAFRSEVAKAGSTYGLWQATDYEPLCGRRLATYFDRLGPPFVYPLAYARLAPAPANLPLIDLLGARWFAAADDDFRAALAAHPELATHWRETWRDGAVALYEYDRALPRAFVAGDVAVLDDPAALLDAMTRADLRRTAFVEAPLAGLPAAGGGAARIVAYAPHRVAIETDGAGGLLVLTDQFAPGWSATVDGAAAPLVRTDYLFRGVPVPPGPHRIEMRYAPTSVWLGAAASALGLVLLVALARLR